MTAVALLDEAQCRVVEHRGGPALVLGGPGTGKTHVLEQRYLRLTEAERMAPHQILLLCSNRAYAVEARDRLVWALPHMATVEVPVYTWHALAYHLVTRYHPALGYREPPVLLTGPEQWGVVRELLAGEHPLDWPLWGDRLRDRAFVDEIADVCLRAEQRLMGPEDLEDLARHRPEWAEVLRFYSRYLEYLKAESRLDYAGLIASAVRLLEGDEGVRQALHQRFPHVLVDDGQELSRAQRELLRRLETRHLVLAADPDSGIEMFRGAEPDWVFGFESLFGPHETLTLDSSYRLGAPLRDAVTRLIQHNGPAPTGPCGPAAHETQFECRMFSSTAEEIEAVARELRHLHLIDGVPWTEMAVLISQPASLLNSLRQALHRWDVPYLPPPAEGSLAAEPAVGCFLDLVRAALRLGDWEKHLPTLLTCPLIGLDYSQRRRLERLAWQQRRTLAEVVEQAGESAEFRKLRDIVLARQARADECFWEVYCASVYYQGLVASSRSDPSHPSNLAVDALVAFGHALGRFVERRHGEGTILEYLQEAARADFGADPWLPPTRGARTDGVALLSFHAARGQEWHTVVVMGCLDAWMPKGRRARGLFDPFVLETVDAAEREVEAIADDRRTFYVAATRARARTLFTASPGPSGRGQPSRFLTELAGGPPVEVAGGEFPPITPGELRGRLRSTLETKQARAWEKVAALIALSELPGTDPTGWYGRWEWTEGKLPLAARGQFTTSYSRLGVYDNCPLQYVLQSVLGLDPTSTPAMKFGTWMHGLFQAVHEGRITDPQTLIATYRAQFDERVFPNTTIARQYQRDGEKMLRTFWDHRSLPDRTVKTEHSFGFAYEGAVLRGRIDRIERVGKNLRLTDYKTTKWPARYQDAQESLQLAIYQLAARRDEELRALGRPLDARLVYPGASRAGGEPSERVQNAAQADKVLEKLPRLIDDVLQERFHPSPTADCDWCLMKPLCPLWPQGRELG